MIVATSNDPVLKDRSVVDRSFLWFLLPTLLQTLIGVGVMVPITTYYLDPADLGTAAILTALAMLVTPLASTGGNTGVILLRRCPRISMGRTIISIYRRRMS